MLNKSEVKYIQSLSDKKPRATHRQFIAEGPKVIADLINERPSDIIAIYAVASWMHKNAAIENRFSVKPVEAFELEKISALQHPQEVLAVVKMPEEHFIPFKKDSWHLMLDGIQDPGNMGSILRIADWFGVHAIYCSNDTVDIYNPKVVQAAMGSNFRVPVCYGDCIEWLSGWDLPVYVTVLDGDDIFRDVKPAPGIVIIGNEGNGARDALIRQADKKLTIPRIGKAESLNAAVATGIVLSQLVMSR